VYVADWGNKRIQEFTDTGTYLCQWGNSGANPLDPIDWLIVAPSGKAYVIDIDSVRIYYPQ
jgi:hypothetical protein